MRQQGKDLREAGRVILAHGEATGHCHEVVAVDPAVVSELCYFEDPETQARTVLLTQPAMLVHQEHGAIRLDPANPQQVRQGDVLLLPQGPGCWTVRRQAEELGPDTWRQVAD